MADAFGQGAAGFAKGLVSGMPAAFERKRLRKQAQALEDKKRRVATVKLFVSILDPKNLAQDPAFVEAKVFAVATALGVDIKSQGFKQSLKFWKGMADETREAAREAIDELLASSPEAVSDQRIEGLIRILLSKPAEGLELVQKYLDRTVENRLKREKAEREAELHPLNIQAKTGTERRAEAEETRRQTLFEQDQADRGTEAPEGFRVTPEGVLEPIPGGPKDPAYIGKVEGAKKTAELKARRININNILGMEEGEPSAAIFSGNTLGQARGKGDAVRLAELLAGSRKLMRAGETSMANSWLSQARFLADHSPELRTAAAMDKPISADLAARLGVPVGTTLGEVRDARLPSPEQQAYAVSRHKTLAKNAVEAQTQVGFIDQALNGLQSLVADIELDPGIVGIRGSLRATGKTAVGVLSDLGLGDLVKTARDLAFSSTDMKLDEMRDLFDNPRLSVLKTMENSFGLILARLRNPEGRVLASIVNKSIEDVKLSGLTSTQQVIDRLTFITTSLTNRKNTLSQQFRLDEQDRPKGNAPEYKLNENNKLVPVR